MIAANVGGLVLDQAEHPHLAAALAVCLGGLITNTKLQALDAEGKVIPGLVLAGNTVGRRFKNDYPVMLPGLSHSMAWTTGYLAGKFATEEA